VALWNFESRCKTGWKKIMAKITAYIPEPKPDYEVENQRQILQAVDRCC
jgi:hypothetical protein